MARKRGAPVTDAARKTAERLVERARDVLAECSRVLVRASDERDLIEMADRFSLEKVVVIPLFGGVYPSPQEVEAGNRAADERILRRHIDQGKTMGIPRVPVQAVETRP